MAPTFYGVLGVGPDADADAIEMGYRERVTEVHPDVNDDPDADAQFRRLTTARETLLDADERARYDRLGHASYVRHHVSCSAWESTVSGTSSVETTDTETDDAGTDDTETGRDSGGDWNAHSTGTEQSRERSQASVSGQRRQRRRRAAGRTPDGVGGATGERNVGSAETAGPDSRRTGRSGDGQGATRRGRRSRASADAAGDASYATSSFWDSQRVGERYGTNTASRESLLLRALGVLRALGPWALVHAVFLAAAVGTSWYVYVVLLDANAVSPLLLVVLVGEIALAVTLSTIHILTRVSR
jgi:curved DNA-binding protein CbpA